MSKPTFIYVMGSTDGREIKIGKATSVANRKRQHESSMRDGCGLAFLASVRGMPSDESALHRTFEPFLSRPGRSREWFHPSPEITEWARWLRQQWYSGDSENDDDIPHVSSEHWMPCNGRRVPEPDQLAFDVWPHFSKVQLTGDDFYTHETIIEAARLCMGEIDLDPATHPVANMVVKAPRFYTIEDDGLSRSWAGRVWLNPPFGQWNLWIPKVIHELDRGEVEQLCLLIPSRSSTAQSMTPAMSRCNALFVPRGRIPFWGEKAASPDEGHFILYFGSNVSQFADSFRKLGNIYQIHSQVLPL